MWHEHEEAAVIDIIQSSNLIIVGCIELSFKLILSWTWEVMSWCLTIYIFLVYKLKAVSTEVLHEKFWLDNLDGFCVQIIYNSIGERRPLDYNRMELDHSLRTIWILLSDSSHRGKLNSKYVIIYWALSNPERIWWHLQIISLLRLYRPW